MRTSSGELSAGPRKTLTTISVEDSEIIFACKESFLYNGDVSWVKREGEKFGS